MKGISKEDFSKNCLGELSNSSSRRKTHDCFCSDPRARPDPIGESEPKPWGRPFNSFYLHFYYVFFFKSVVTRIPGSTRRADPNRSSVYSDVFNYLIKTFSLCYFSLGFRFARKHFQMVGPQTFTFHKMQFQ